MCIFQEPSGVFNSETTIYISFSVIFTTSYRFELPSTVISLQAKELPLRFLVYRSAYDKFSHFVYLKMSLLHFHFEGLFATCKHCSIVFWPPLFLMEVYCHLYYCSLFVICHFHWLFSRF